MTASPAPANATSAPAPSAYDALSAPAVTSFLRRHALERPQHSAIVDGATGEVVTYAELLAQVLAQAEDFREAGIALGDLWAFSASTRCRTRSRCWRCQRWA